MPEPGSLRPGLIIVLALTVLSGCAGQPPLPERPATAAASGVPGSIARMPGDNAITDVALAMVGSPYAYGGADPRGFDCSGLVYYAYRRVGIAVPRTSLEQYRKARKIRLSQARPGDLVFFQDQAQLSHVGIYIGDSRFVHAPASGRSVSVADLNEPYFQMHLVGVGRLAEL